MKTNAQKPLPYFSFFSSLVCGASLVVLALLPFLHAAESTGAAHQVFLLSVMVTLLVALGSAVISLITAWCPIILGGDPRPLFWVVPLVLAWFVFGQVFDWRSLVTF